MCFKMTKNSILCVYITVLSAISVVDIFFINLEVLLKQPNFNRCDDSMHLALWIFFTI